MKKYWKCFTKWACRKSKRKKSLESHEMRIMYIVKDLLKSPDTHILNRAIFHIYNEVIGIRVCISPVVVGSDVIVISGDKSSFTKITDTAYNKLSEIILDEVDRRLKIISSQRDLEEKQKLKEITTAIYGDIPTNG